MIDPTLDIGEPPAGWRADRSYGPRGISIVAIGPGGRSVELGRLSARQDGQPVGVDWPRVRSFFDLNLVPT